MENRETFELRQVYTVGNSNWERQFLVDALNTYIQFIHKDNIAAGWWTINGVIMTPQAMELSKWRTTFQFFVAPYIVATKFALIHSEVSEAMEAYRRDSMDDKLPNTKGVEVELADAVIRIFDLAGALGFGHTFGETLLSKLDYNAVRADHKVEARQAKGGKRF